MTPANSISATNKVLTNPILLERIFAWILEDDLIYLDPAEDSDASSVESGTYNVESTLVHCAQVCKEWFPSAARTIWRNSIRDSAVTAQWNFSTYFEKIEPGRRQIYADFVESAELVLIEDKERACRTKELVEDLRFPNLTSIVLFVASYQWNDDIFHEIPIFHAPGLKSLEIDPHFECEFGHPEYFVSQDEWVRIFDLIVVSFLKSF